MENESILLYMCSAVHLLVPFCVGGLSGEHSAAICYSVYVYDATRGTLLMYVFVWQHARACSMYQWCKITNKCQKHDLNVSEACGRTN